MLSFRLSAAREERLLQECRFQYSRSSGPGGQKVNKTETRVELIWPIRESGVFSSDQQERIEKKLSSRMNRHHELLFASDRYRSRKQNQQHCLRKLVTAIEKALTQPKKRKKTKPTRSSVEKRIKEKKQRSDTKKMRQKVYK